MKKFFKKVWEIIKKIWSWFYSLFTTRYNIVVSYDSEWGNNDDQYFNNVRSISKQTQNELKFIDENKSPVVIRSAAGLNYKIEEV